MLAGKARGKRGSKQMLQIKSDQELYHRNKENNRPKNVFPENYLEIGNGLPTRKNSVWKLFVIGNGN